MSYNYQEWALWCKLNLNTWNTLFTVETYLCYLQMRCSLLLCLLLFKSAAHNSVFFTSPCDWVCACDAICGMKKEMTFSWPLTCVQLKARRGGRQGAIMRVRHCSSRFCWWLIHFRWLLFLFLEMSHYIDLIGFIAIQAEASLEESQGSWTVLVCHITSLFQLQTKENLFPLACEGRL